MNKTENVKMGNDTKSEGKPNAKAENLLRLQLKNDVMYLLT